MRKRKEYFELTNKLQATIKQVMQLHSDLETELDMVTFYDNPHVTTGAYVAKANLRALNHAIQTAHTFAYSLLLCDWTGE